jgi:hypothetical protein
VEIKGGGLLLLLFRPYRYYKAKEGIFNNATFYFIYLFIYFSSTGLIRV